LESGLNSPGSDRLGGIGYSCTGCREAPQFCYKQQLVSAVLFAKSGA
jgi:hypothetical protein